MARRIKTIRSGTITAFKVRFKTRARGSEFEKTISFLIKQATRVIVRNKPSVPVSAAMVTMVTAVVVTVEIIVPSFI
jgi:hypothetical protein